MATVSKWALLNGQGVCVNIIQWDGNTQTYDPAPLTAVAYNPAIHVVAADPLAVNRDSLTSKATTAVAANITYINLASPSTAQNAGQIKALTKQVDALIKLVLNQLDDTSGT